MKQEKNKIDFKSLRIPDFRKLFKEAVKTMSSEDIRYCLKELANEQWKRRLFK